MFIFVWVYAFRGQIDRSYLSYGGPNLSRSAKNGLNPLMLGGNKKVTHT